MKWLATDYRAHSGRDRKRIQTSELPCHVLVTNWDKQVANTQSPLLFAFVTAPPSLQSDVYFQNSLLWAEYKNSMAVRNVQWSVTARQLNILCNCDFGAWDFRCSSAFSACCFHWDPKLLAKLGPFEDTAGMAYEVTGPPVCSFHWGNTAGSYFHCWWDTITALANVSLVFHCKDKCMHQVTLYCKRLGECGVVNAWATRLVIFQEAWLQSWNEKRTISSVDPSHVA